MSSDTPTLTRRTVLGGTAALLGCGGRSVGGKPRMVPPQVAIYSPAAPDNPLHALNMDLAHAMRRSAPEWPVRMPSVALPESVNRLAAANPAERALHLPIVTSLDLPAARAGAGPAWHAYLRANTDLRFVSKLYDVGFGIMPVLASITAPSHLRDKRIGAPPRPSAVRWLTEALLRDGWGIIDEVEIVDMPASDTASAIREGRIDATAWNLVVPDARGFRPSFAALSDRKFLPVAADVVERLNARQRATLALLWLLPQQPALIGFGQALAAWNSTPDDLVAALARAIRADVGTRPGLPRTERDMVAWPGLTAGLLHPAVGKLDAFA